MLFPSRWKTETKAALQFGHQFQRGRVRGMNIQCVAYVYARSSNLSGIPSRWQSMDQEVPRRFCYGAVDRAVWGVRLQDDRQHADSTVRFVDHAADDGSRVNGWSRNPNVPCCHGTLQVSDRCTPAKGQGRSDSVIYRTLILNDLAGQRSPKE